jgi:hypothetical protein
MIVRIYHKSLPDSILPHGSWPENITKDKNI